MGFGASSVAVEHRVGRQGYCATAVAVWHPTSLALNLTLPWLGARPIYQKPIIVGEVGQIVALRGIIFPVGSMFDELRPAIPQEHPLIGCVVLRVPGGSDACANFGGLRDLDRAIGEGLFES
jgi:hypothetical protein